jgi:hypothetical protein
MRTLAVLAALAMMAGRALAEPPAEALAEPPAEARDKRIIGVLDVRVEGVPKEIARQFQSDLERQLDSRAYWLATQQRMREMMANSTKWTEGCVVGRCLDDVKTQTGADVVLLATISGAGTSFGHVVTLVRTNTGRVLAQDASRCEVCTVNEALTNATLAAVQLLTALPDKLPDEAGEEAADLEMSKLYAEHSATRQRHRTIGIAMTLVGIVSAGAGMALYLTADRADAALAGAGVGAGLALGGVVVLTF